MIISTGMRTDIPAFYSQWFLNRIKDGFVYVRNPYYHNQITKYLLTPEVVDCICFCTKNPTPLISHLDELKKFKQFWFVTISAYGSDYEPNVPDKLTVIEAFKKLSNILGINAVGWRYDPIFYDEIYNEEKHIKIFENIATKLKGYTNQCVVSFLDMYEKVKNNAPNIFPPTKEQQISLMKKLVKIAEENGIKIRSCCEGTYLKDVGVDVGGCQTKEVIEKAIDVKLKVPQKKNARVICNCLLGQDIGSYNSCGHLCKYCYANINKNIVIQNMKKHNPYSPLFIGNIEKTDVITDAKQQSFAVNQISLF